MHIHSFGPIVDENCKVLILGSIPGVKSLEKNQYYGHPRNRFWKIIYTMFNEKLEEDYDKRVKFLLTHKIALWDVVKSCYREGSLDSNIKEPQINDFESLFLRYPNIKFIFFNGSKAEELFKRKVDKKLIKEKQLFRLPSTSPARAISFDEKLKYWMKIKECLEE